MGGQANTVPHASTPRRAHNNFSVARGGSCKTCAVRDTYHEDDPNAVPLQVRFHVVQHVSNRCEIHTATANAWDQDAHSSGVPHSAHPQNIWGEKMKKKHCRLPSVTASGTAMTTKIPPINHTTTCCSTLCDTSSSMITAAVAATCSNHGTHTNHNQPHAARRDTMPIYSTTLYMSRTALYIM